MTSTSSGALAVVLVLSIFTGAVPVSSYISQPVHMFNDSSAHITTHTETRLINGYNTTAYYAWIGNPIDHFHVLYPELANGSCGHYLYPSRVARRVGCEYATNGGPFVRGQFFGQTCLGYIVSEGKFVQAIETTNANFGVTKDGHYIMGTLSPSDVQTLGFEDLVTGFQQLMINGEIVDLTPGGEIAPRTTIGTDKDGNLIIFEADGVEDEPNGHPKGLTVLQTAQWVKSLGAYNVVNLDGGGSSVTVINGTIVDHPTCVDTPLDCERLVTTMTCILP